MYLIELVTDFSCFIDNLIVNKFNFNILIIGYLKVTRLLYYLNHKSSIKIF
jgi:hypothetical protein